MNKKKSLVAFDSAELSRIIEELGSVPRIFNSEAQFQFELAWKIKSLFSCDVKLEELSRVYPLDGKTKKDYTDIILENGNYRVGIELKYKTAEYIDKSNKIWLMNHGAVDLGSYDFLKDVYRLQTLTFPCPKTSDEYILKCDKAFAVILTNDNHYWKCNSNNTLTTKGINRQFLIGAVNTNNKTYISKGIHQWYDTSGKPGLSKALLKDKSRQNSIKFIKNYNYEWQAYCKTNAYSKNCEFKYMIVEVCPNTD